MLPKYRRHKGQNLGYVEYRGDVTYFKGPYGSPASRAAYNAFIHALTADQPDPEPSEDAGVDELLYAFLMHAEGYFGADTAEFKHFRRICEIVSDQYGPTPLRDFGPRALKKLQKWLVCTGISRRFANRQINRIIRIWRWGVSEQWVKPEALVALRSIEPLRKGKTTAADPKKVKPVPWRHVRKVLPFLAPQVRDMVWLQRLTGMRSSQLCAMKPRYIKRMGDLWLYEPAKHKTEWRDQDLQIWLGRHAQKVLAKYLNRNPDAYLFSPAEATAWRRAQKRLNRKTPVQPSQVCRAKRSPRKTPGDRYTTDSYRRAVYYAIRRSGGVHWHPHQLRHSRATRVRSRYNIEAAKAALGHADIEATLIYAERDRTLARRVAAEIG